MQDKDKLDYKNTFMIAFGFFALSLAWAIYNANVPLILEKYITSTSLIGAIMAIDNIFAAIFQPIVGSLSDRTVTRYGRRLPYILAGLPICAVLFIFIPYMNNMITLLIIIVFFNFFMSVWRSPAVSLMPDVTPSHLRCKANGIIHLMGGLGGVLAYLIGGILLTKVGTTSPFIFGSIIMILSWISLYLFVHEPHIQIEEKEKTVENCIKEKGKVKKKSEMNRSLLSILLAIFFWYVGFSVVETYFTLYATNVLHVKRGVASIILTFFSFALVLGAYPAGVLGTRIGRKKTIIIGLVSMIILFCIQINTDNVYGIVALLIFEGLSWSCINTNSLPMVLEIAKSSSIGKYVGFYYFFSSSASIVGPPLFGVIHDITNDYEYLFMYAGIAFILALISIAMAKHGEAIINQDEITKEAEELDL